MRKSKINIEDLFEMESAVIFNPDSYKASSNVTIDSRSVKKGSIFFAIKGLKFDGHKFITEAIKQGASAVVINSRMLKKLDDVEVTIIAVKDTTKAYGELANTWRKKLGLKVISLTGSNGKTSTKEMLYTLLSEKFIMHKSPANDNNHIGVPKTIFECTDKHDAVVIEHGTNHFGEIEYSARIAQPDIAAITNVGDSHLEFLKNRKGVLQEKSALLEHTADDGKVLINMDDILLSKEAKNYKNVIKYGFKGRVDCKGKLIGFTADGRTKINISYGKKNLETTLPILGISNAKNYLLAVTIAFEIGLPKREVLTGTKKLVAYKGRLESKVYKEFMLIDDTYNASPDSVRAGLDLLRKVKCYKNKLVILGDMFELGISATKLHADLAESFVGIKNLRVMTIGSFTKKLSNNLIKNKIDAKHFSQRQQLEKELNNVSLTDSVILVKGSRGMKMEDFASVIKDRG